MTLTVRNSRLRAPLVSSLLLAFFTFPTIAQSSGLHSRLLLTLANPDLDVLLLLAGVLLIYLETNLPGTIVPGAVGLLCVLFAISGLSLLPVRHSAIAVLLLSLVLFVFELKFSSHGVLALIGTVTLIFGLATLVDGPPEIRVHLSTAIAAGLTFGAITFALAWIALTARRNKHLTGPEAMHGLLAEARTPLEPRGDRSGQVLVRGELWSAFLAPDSPPVTVEQQTVVVAVEGLTLIVRALPPKV